MGWRGSTHISNVLWFPLQADQLVDINHGHFELALTTSRVSRFAATGVVVESSRTLWPEKKVAEKLENTNRALRRYDIALHTTSLGIYKNLWT